MVDRFDRVVGSATRSEVRRRRLPHRAVYVFVRDGEGRLLVHRRTVHKDIYPGYWDVAAGGVVGAGEDYRRAARRELAEELGITGVPLRERLRFWFEDSSNAVRGAAFTCRWNGPVRPQPEEVAAVQWAAVEEVLVRSRSEAFCPDSLYALRLLLARWR